jgi:ferredoxin
MNNANEPDPEVELSDCIECGVCADLCPDVFEMTDAGYVRVIDLQAYPRDCVDEAIKYCPADCIHWNSGNPAGEE